MLHFSSALLNCAGCFFFPSCKCALYLAKLCKWHKRCCFPHFQVSITEHGSTIFISPPNDSHSCSCIRTSTLAGKISIAFSRHSRVNKQVAPNKKMFSAFSFLAEMVCWGCCCCCCGSRLKSPANSGWPAWCGHRHLRTRNACGLWKYKKRKRLWLELFGWNFMWSN